MIDPRSPTRGARAALGLLAAGLLGGALGAGCAAPSDDAPRSAWLRSTLLADNRAVMIRFPADSRGKLAKMASTPYNFLRGTAAQGARDLLQPGPHQQPSRYTSTAASRRAILGDAHLENVGSYLVGGRRLLVDFNDFDAATFGPYHLDVWRLCTSIGVAFSDAPPSTRRRWIRAVALRYAEAIGALARGEAPLIVDAARPASIVFADLLERARRDGEAGEKLATYTRVDAGVRRMYHGEIEPPGRGFVGDVVWAPSPAEEAAITAALATWPESLVDPAVVGPGGPRIKGIARRLGAGVSSYPLPRYYALLEGPTADPADDWLVELKEAGDPLLLPRLEHLPWPRFDHNAARVIDLQRRLQAYLDDDPLLGQAVLAPHAFRVRRREGYQKNISVDRLHRRWTEGRWLDSDLEAAFGAMGALLARAHGGARGADGQTGAAPIAAAIGGDVEGFATEATDFALGYAPVILADYHRFRALLRDHGPLLGYRPDPEHL